MYYKWLLFLSFIYFFPLASLSISNNSISLYDESKFDERTLSALRQLKIAQTNINSLAFEEARKHLLNISNSEVFLNENKLIKAHFEFTNGLLNRKIKNFKEAELQLQKSIYLFSEINGNDVYETTISMMNLGELYCHDLFDFEKAEPYLQKAYQNISKSDVYSINETARIHYDLGMIYYGNYELEQAIKFGEEALKIEQQNERRNWALIADIYHLFLITKYDKSNFNECIEWSKKAIKIREDYLQQDVFKYLFEKVWLAINYYENQEYERALAYAQETLEEIKLENSNGDFNYLQALIEFEIGRNYAKLNNIEGSIDHFEKSYRGMQLEYGECSNRSTLHFNMLSNIFKEVGEFDQALAYINQAISCFSNSEKLDKYDYNEIATFHGNRASLLSNNLNSNKQDIINSYLKADSLFKMHRLTSAWKTSKLDGFNNSKYIYDEAIQFSYQQYQLKGEIKYINAAFQLIESSKAFLLFESLNESLWLKKEEINNDDKSKLVSISNAIKKEESILLNEQSDESLKNLERLKRNKEILLKSLEGDLISSSQASFYKNQILLKRLQENLAAEEGLVLFYASNDRYFRIYVSKTRIEFDKIKINDELSTFLHHFNNFKPKLFSKDDFNDYQKHANQLYEILLGDLKLKEQYIKIIPDKELYFIPFDALTQSIVDADNFNELDYFVKDHIVSYGYSVAHIYNVPNNNKKIKSALSVSYKNDGISEIETHDQFFKTFPNTSKLNVDNNYESIISEIISKDILHFATHGFVDTSSLEASYLSLSDDLKLKAYEISTLDLNADLVFINACSTTKGKYQTGEGVFSMARSFLQGGCPTTIASLWNIPDKSSSLVSGKFYKNFKKGNSPSKMLHLAKNDFLQDESISEYQKHPYYWAGLSCIGKDEVFNVIKSIERNLIFFFITLITILLIRGYRIGFR